jgi:hypothetical protein
MSTCYNGFMANKRKSRKQNKLNLSDHDPVEVNIAIDVAVDMGQIPEIMAEAYSESAETSIYKGAMREWARQLNPIT